MKTFASNILRVALIHSLLLFSIIGAAQGRVEAETSTLSTKNTAVTTLISPTLQKLTGTVNKTIASSQPYSSTGFVGTVIFSVSPALPAGLTIDSKGAVSGTPTLAQVAKSYTVTATGATSGKAQATVNITIAAAPIDTSSLNCPSAPFLTAAGEGRRAYMRLNCYSCHGDKGKGGMGPNISGAESGDVQEAVTSGAEGGMPAFKNYLCPNDISNLSAYLKVIGSTTAPTFKQWWVQNPTQ